MRQVKDDSVFSGNIFGFFLWVFGLFLLQVDVYHLRPHTHTSHCREKYRSKQLI